MIFTKIEIKNFGIFCGKHIFNLTPNQSSSSAKPIILFGGKNGSGKTTLFEAIRLCLYGSSFKGRKMYKSLYHKHLRQRLNRNVPDALNPRKASICVEFEYGRFGSVDTYLVRRSWECARDKTTVESLEIHQNGRPLRDIDEEQWQDFLKELVPLGVSKLFFFDGEQIQNLAEDHADNRHLISSIHSLLGIDLVERLQTDLRIYVSRKAKEENQQLAREIPKFKNNQIMLREQLDSTLQKKAQVQSQIDRVQGEIEHQEHQIAKEGGGYASKREKLKLQRQALDEEIETAKERIRRLCAGLLPFSLVPDLCSSLRKRLQVEREYQQRIAAQAALRSTQEKIIKEISSESFWEGMSLLHRYRKELADKIAEAFKRNITNKEVGSMQISHQISFIEREKILDWTNQVLSYVPVELEELSTRLEKLVRQRQDVDTQLYHAPLDDVLHPFILKLNMLHKELGVLQENYRHLDEDVRKVQNRLKMVERQTDKLLAQQEKSRKLSERVMLARKVQVVLNEFITRLGKDKIVELSERFVESFKWLSNKAHLIEGMEIDPRDFSTKIWEDDGKTIPKNQLSAGERQIYAVAMLWALARTSGRPLPFMIDTPLGRLDADHRENIVQNFFPHASHQIILFSTDTEIDQRLFEKLQPYISRAYHLEYDELAGTTRASTGYFWKAEKEVVVGELQ